MAENIGRVPDPVSGWSGPHLVRNPRIPLRLLLGPPVRTGPGTYLSGLLSTARPRADNGSAYLYNSLRDVEACRHAADRNAGRLHRVFGCFPPDRTNVRLPHTEIDISRHLGHDPATCHDGSTTTTGAHPIASTALRQHGACPVPGHTRPPFHRFARIRGGRPRPCTSPAAVRPVRWPCFPTRTPDADHPRCHGRQQPASGSWNKGNFWTAPSHRH